MADLDLDATLRATAASLTVEDADAFARRVLARAGATKATTARHRRRVAVAALVATMLSAAGAPAAWALARRVFSIGAVTVVEDPADVTPPSVAAATPTTPAAAGSSGPLPLPTLLGPPTAQRTEGDQQSALWAPTAANPATPGDQSIGVLFSRLPGAVEREAFIKIVPDPSAVREVVVRGRPALWIVGAHQFVVRRSDTYEVVELRLAANVLLWTEGDVTYRLELAGTLAEALAIAASLP